MLDVETATVGRGDDPVLSRFAPGGRRLEGDFVVLQAKGEPSSLDALLPATMCSTGDVLIYLGWLQETERDGIPVFNWPYHEWGICVAVQRRGWIRSMGSFIPRRFTDNRIGSIRDVQPGDVRRSAEIAVTPRFTDDSSRYTYVVSSGKRILVSASVYNLEPLPAAAFPLHEPSICTAIVNPVSASARVGGSNFGYGQIDIQSGETKRGRASIEIAEGTLDMPIGSFTDVTGYFGRCAVVYRGDAVTDRTWRMTA